MSVEVRVKAPMLLLGIFLNVAFIFSLPTSAVPFDPRALSPVAATPHAYRSPSQLTEFRWRNPNASGSSNPPNEAISSSESTRNLEADVHHEIQCIPRGYFLPYANADYCKFIINSMILAMKDPFWEQSWGFTDFVDINLSLPQYKWKFQSCYLRVKNLDESQVDRFRPVDVAELAQRIVQRCIIDTKERLGGNSDIGHLGVPESFFVVVSGAITTSSQSPRNITVLSLPSDGLRALESRTSPGLPQGSSISSIPTAGLEAGERPVDCFDPTLTHRFKPTIASECFLIVNEIILRLPNPMIEQTFGYTDAEDVNLSEKENSQWVYGQCAVFVRALDTSSRDRFRYLDVAYAAHRIIDECVAGAKYAIGGTVNVGIIEDNFYVGVGGIDRYVGNGTFLELASDAAVPSPSGAISA